jgi:hypothetical protein
MGDSGPLKAAAAGRCVGCRIPQSRAGDAVAAVGVVRSSGVLGTFIQMRWTGGTADGIGKAAKRIRRNRRRSVSIRDQGSEAASSRSDTQSSIRDPYTITAQRNSRLGVVDRADGERGSAVAWRQRCTVAKKAFGSPAGIKSSNASIRNAPRRPAIVGVRLAPGARGLQHPAIDLPVALGLRGIARDPAERAAVDERGIESRATRSSNAAMTVQFGFIVTARS